MKPTDRAPVNPIDRDIAEAFAALDRKTPELDDFSSRVLARLDDGGERPSRDAALDDSGLHDIVALAKSARRRITERGASESDDDSAVLLAVAHGGLRAVALPDPVRGRARGKTGGAARERLRAETRSSAPFWVLGSVASIAAAAAVAVFVFGIGRRPRAVLDQVADETAEPAAPAQAVPASTPPSAPAAPEPSPPQVPGDRPVLVTPEEPALKRDDAKSRRRQRIPVSPKDAPPERAEPVSESEGASLDEALDRAIGQGTSPAELEDKKKREEAQAAREARKPLGRGDVAQAMQNIRPSVERCAEKGEGATVTVKLVVGPTGRVISAEPTGAHAGTPLGACVAEAAKAARFREFDGEPSTFDYPFVLPGSP